ncbi:hypothetical protein GJV76_13360 [Myroides sp. BIT-d1]|uniref:Uncharacterized protein n=1 Tax=Myroides albus TaxID=2562892 RepID=A0A6I3LKG9_9FLAO|nr:hypothetical protein [Myroides albus]MTG99108.1 hypothetical protein [Myroides albus]
MSKLINYQVNIESIGCGKANDIEDFFEQIIRPQFSNKQGIIKIHQELLKYIESPNAIFFLRQHFSASKKNYHLLRRGFLSEYKCGAKVVFCDNTFAMLFNGPKLNNDYYSCEDLHNLFIQKQLICGFSSTTEERELSFYSSNGVKRLKYNLNGWTLAHINPVGTGYEQGNIRDFFPCLDRELWNNPQRINTVHRKLETQELKLLKAHFLRLIHPLNSFFLPKNNLISFVSKAKRLGEEMELLKHVYSYLKVEFDQQINELENIMGKCEFKNIEEPIHTITWSMDKKKIAKQKNQYGKEKGYVKDTFHSDKGLIIEEEIAIKLDNWLCSVGKKAFRDILYPAIKENPNITHSELADMNDIFASYKEASQKSRLSTAKSILKNNLEEEALLIIELSKRVRK